jgi:ketosteroid isomerase-like protein/TolB-like protein
VRKKFDETFIDLGRQQLKNIPYPVRAYLMVPRQVAAQHLPARRRVATHWWGASAAAVVLLAAAAGMLWHVVRSAPGEKPGAGGPRDLIGVAAGPPKQKPAVVAEVSDHQQQVALGVMLFKGLGGDTANDWRREALRDGLNTQLSRLSRVKVYSKEFIDFLITRKGLTEIEAATQLGISKMLSGSFVVLDGTMRIETHVVDVTTGLLESSFATVGREDDFLNLQGQVALGAVSRLNLPVTDAEKQILLAQRATDEAALKMVLEAEGGVAAAPSEKSERKPTPGPRSALPQWFAFARVLAVPAWADDATARSAILDAIERYRRAIEARDLPAVAAIYAEFPPEQQAAQQRYFDNVRDLKISVDKPDIAVVGDEAVVSYTRTDDFVDARTGRPMHVAVRLTKILRQQPNGEWKMAGK